MNSPLAIVSDILTFSCVDGPGNRLVLFFQGCNFDCLGCHNPHTIDFCNNCGDCIPACHAEALSIVEGKIVFDPTNCDKCDACIKACPIQANPMVQQYTVPQVLDMLRDNRFFIEGVTVSGGEATVQLQFIIKLFQAVKSDPELSHLTCLIDSNGHLPRKAWDTVLPWTDGVMLDIKALDREKHIYLTGKPNARVLETARHLREKGKLQEIRYLIVPGQNDHDAEISGLCELHTELGTDLPVRLNAFQHHGVTGPARDWPKATKNTVEGIAERLRDNGAQNVTLPALYL